MLWQNLRRHGGLSRRVAAPCGTARPVPRLDGPSAFQHTRFPAANKCAAIKQDSLLNVSIHLETRVLVTGGAGFLGSHLCERLLATGASVICVDNYFTGTRRNIESMLD